MEKASGFYCDTYKTISSSMVHFLNTVRSVNIIAKIRIKNFKNHVNLGIFSFWKSDNIF